MKYLFFFLILLCGCVSHQSDSTSTLSPLGNIIAIGGGKRSDAVIKQIVKLQSKGPFLIVPMASGIADTIGWEHRDLFLELGANQVEIMMLTESDSTNSTVVKKFRSAGGIWFSGGNQNKLMRYIGSEAIRSAIIQAYVNGAVIAGTSAGTAILSELMITGDEKYPINERVYFGQIRKDNVLLSRGLGLIHDIVVDQHFIRRSRQNRLITVLLDSPVKAVVGIDEATALWIKPSAMVEIIGDGQVIWWEKTKHSRIGYSDSLLAASNISMFVLPSGSSFKLNNEKRIIQLKMNSDYQSLPYY